MYIQHLKRLFQPKRYPLYRIVKMRYILLHILILSIIMASPAIINYFKTFQAINQISQSELTAIPDFKVVDHELILSQEKEIELSTLTLAFTENNVQPRSNFIILDKDEILISKSLRIQYANINMFQDKETLIQFFKTFTDSIYFYFLILVLLIISSQYFITTLKIIIISIVSHIISKSLNKKSRYMNWLKINTFILTLPALLLLLGVIFKFIILTIASWIVLIILDVLTIKYLPNQKHKAKQN